MCLSVCNISLVLFYMVFKKKKVNLFSDIPKVQKAFYSDAVV